MTDNASFDGASFLRRALLMARQSRRILHAVAIVVAMVLATAVAPARAAPEGELTWAVHITLAPTWLDPAETTGAVTIYMTIYAIHDAMLKAMPGNAKAPSLAEAWTVSPDGLVYEFVLRKGAKFHNGDDVTSEDVKFSFERYRGISQKTLKDHVASIETPDPLHVRFRLKEPWPDFLTFYVVTGASWIVPKKYVEKVGEDGFKKAPVGAGPYKFVSFTPGQELRLEAFEAYWRKTPSVKRLMLRVIPDETTRLAALKRGEVDIAYSIRGELAEELARTKGLSLKPTFLHGTYWLQLNDQWDPKSPWHDLRVRKAALLAIDRDGINQALTLGHSRITGSIIPEGFDLYWRPPKPAHDPAEAKKLLAEAGFPRGFDAGDFYMDTAYANLGEAVANDLQAVGIRVKLRPLERAAYYKGWEEKSFKNIIQAQSGAFGNAVSRIEGFVAKGGIYVTGSHPDIDELFQEQARELDPKKREALVHQIQQLMVERVMFIPIWQLGFLNAAGPRVGESGLGLIPGHPYSAPYEDVTLKGK
jgi:peptide/nickel transport system substrate-binding protein